MKLAIKSYYNEHKTLSEESLSSMLRDFDTESIHKMRTSTKRLWALFILLRFVTDGGFDSKKQLTEARHIFKQAGKIREIQIEQMLVKQVETENTLTYPEYLVHLENLEEKKIAGFRESIADIENFEIILDDDLIYTTIDSVSDGQLKTGIRQFIESRKAKIQQNVLNPSSNHKIHRVRTWLKQLYYLWDILSRISGNENFMSPNAEHIREIEQAIGSWHDLVNSEILLTDFKNSPNSGVNDQYKRYQEMITEKRELLRTLILNEYFRELA